MLLNQLLDLPSQPLVLVLHPQVLVRLLRQLNPQLLNLAVVYASCAPASLA